MDKEYYGVSYFGSDYVRTRIVKIISKNVDISINYENLDEELETVKVVWDSTYGNGEYVVVDDEFDDNDGSIIINDGEFYVKLLPCTRKLR